MSDTIHSIEVDGDVGEHVTDLLDEITRLRAENERLREALEALLLQALQSELNTPANEWGLEAIEQARAALKENSDD